MVDLAEAGDSGGSILHIKPASYLSMPLEGLAPGGAGSGEASPRRVMGRNVNEILVYEGRDVFRQCVEIGHRTW